MTGDKLINLAIPVFFALIFMEILWSRKHRPGSYRLPDSISNLSAGVIYNLLALLFAFIPAGIYIWFYQVGHLFNISPEDIWYWVLAIVGLDFCYYWAHRFGHEINLFWAAHVVHHQSEEYNLSVALRQSGFGFLYSWVFYIPLALVGLPLEAYAIGMSINLIYQFWIHTEVIRSMGSLEWILNTPSHHRVHHGTNLKYLDKNYGGIFIIWDRLFGTFEPEVETARYGVLKPLQNWNPFHANFHTWRETFRESKDFVRLSDKLRIWLKNPGWQPEDRSIRDTLQRVIDKPFPKFDTPYSRAAAIYGTLFFIIGLSLGIATIPMQTGTSWPFKALFAVASMMFLGAGTNCFMRE